MATTSNPRKNALPRRRFVQKTARAFFERIERNFKAYQAGRITTAEFNRRQREIWDDIESKSPEVHMEVERLLRVPWSPGRNGAPRRNPAYPIIEMDRDTGEPTGRKEFYAAHNQYEAAKYALATRLLKGPGWKIGPTGLVVYRPGDNKVWVVDVKGRNGNPGLNGTRPPAGFGPRPSGIEAFKRRKASIQRLARELVKKLRRNTDDVYAGRVTDDQFHARQIKLWDAIQKDRRVEEEVLRILRGGLNPRPAGRPLVNRRKRNPWWQGLRSRGAGREVFWSPRSPTVKTYGHRYGAVTGPFKTASGAARAGWPEAVASTIFRRGRRHRYVFPGEPGYDPKIHSRNRPNVGADNPPPDAEIDRLWLEAERAAGRNDYDSVWRIYDQLRAILNATPERSQKWWRAREASGNVFNMIRLMRERIHDWPQRDIARRRRGMNPRKAGGPKPRGPMHPSRWPSWMRDEKAFRAKFGVSTQKFRDMLAFLSASRRAEFQRDVDRGFPELAIRSVVKFLKGNRGRR